MKHTLGMQITIGLLAAVVVAGPVFAETNPTMSESLKRRKKPASTTSQKQEQQSGTAGAAVPGPSRLNLPPIERPVPGQDIMLPSQGES